MPVTAHSSRDNIGIIVTEGKFDILSLNRQDLTDMLSAIDGELIFGLDWRDHGFFEIWYFLYYSNTRPLLHDVALRWRIIDLEEISPSSFRGTAKRVDLAPPDVSTPRHVDADGTCTVTLSAD